MHVETLTSPTGEPADPAAPRVFDSDQATASAPALRTLALGLRNADLAAPPVVLPDFHHKSDMEMPSSIAVATRESIRPTLTSSSVNCGMALVSLTGTPPSPDAMARFFEAVRERYPYPPTRRLELTKTEVLRCANEGAAFAAERFGLPPDLTWAMEERGHLDLERHGGVDRLRRELPWAVLQLSRMRFGTIGPTNHFIELQRVEQVLDSAAAASLGVAQGQLTLQYHGGAGVLAGQVGRLFGRRRKTSRSMRVQMALAKPLYHYSTARSIAELRLRRGLYFANGCPPVERHSREGQRLLLANAAAMNYGFAFRLATYANLCALAGRYLGSDGFRLVVDSPHNSMYEEVVDGAPAIVHRHNACRAFPPELLAGHPLFAGTGQAVLLPGTNRTCSYLAVAGSGAGRSLFSACHGAGTIIADFARRGVSGSDPKRRTTLRFSYDGAAPERVEQLDDRGVDAALGILTANRLVRPVARLRPLGVLN